jgi:hypothetical protein
MAAFFCAREMHLLYLDESGHIDSKDQAFFVLAGVAVFERKAHWLEMALNQIAERFAPQDPYSIELHGSPMRSGREGWKRFPLPDRLQAIQDALRTAVQKQHPKGVRLFGAVIKKTALGAQDPAEIAFEQLCNRFDLFLQRLYRKHNDPQRGLILLDKQRSEKRIQSLAREFKTSGHRWGRVKNYAEVPVFLDSKASRLIQLADLVAFALFRFYEYNDDVFYRVIRHCFDSDGPQEHGLYVHC